MNAHLLFPPEKKIIIILAYPHTKTSMIRVFNTLLNNSKTWPLLRNNTQMSTLYELTALLGLILK